MKTNKGLFFIYGLPFREGGQGSVIYNTPNSYNEQIKACNSHVKLIEHCLNNNICDEISIFVTSISTMYDSDVNSIYEKYLLQSKFSPTHIGLNEVVNFTPELLPNLNDYDFILTIRIDICFEELFFIEFNPNLYKETIHFFSICSYIKILAFEYPSIARMHDIEHPRVNPIIFLIPKKYYKYMNNTMFHHESWWYLVENSKLTIEDIDVMFNNYYDSDSEKDYNHFYYIVNRGRNNHWHSDGIEPFNKYEFYKIRS
jgi:hypothetical protein